MAVVHALNSILIFFGAVDHSGATMPLNYIASRGKLETKLLGNNAVVDVRVRAALDELLSLPLSGLVVAASFLM